MRTAPVSLTLVSSEIFMTECILVMDLLNMKKWEGMNVKSSKIIEDQNKKNLWVPLNWVEWIRILCHLTYNQEISYKLV